MSMYVGGWINGQFWWLLHGNLRATRHGGHVGIGVRVRELICNLWWWWNSMCQKSERRRRRNEEGRVVISIIPANKMVLLAINVLFHI